jgi:Leucine-rich repeat (LRR) protein
MLKIMTSLPVIIFSRPCTNPPPEWVEVDRGPGDIKLPDRHEYGFRIRNIGDDELDILVKEMAEIDPLTFANLSENRNIDDEGLELLRFLPKLTILNLSSCGLTNEGIANLKVLTHLADLDLSFCNRLTGPALKHLREMPSLQKLNLQGCVKITNGDMARFRRPNVALKK